MVVAEGTTAEGMPGVLLQLPTEHTAWAHYEKATSEAAAAAGPKKFGGIEAVASDFVGCKVTESRAVDGTAYYRVLWIDKRGRQYMVWRRYSKFLSLRQELIEQAGGAKAAAVKELEFPKKKRLKGGRMQREREERTAILSSWLAKVRFARVCARVQL